MFQVQGSKFWKNNLEPWTRNLEPPSKIFDGAIVKSKIEAIFALLLKNRTMSVTRLKRKNRKDKAKSAIRRQSLKNQNAKPVVKNVDVDAIKAEFKAKASK